MQPIEQLSPENLEFLRGYFSDDKKIVQWLTAPNFSLRGLTPLSQLSLPNGQAVVGELIGQLLYGHVV